MIPFNKAAWYWFVGDDHTQVYSSVDHTYLPITHPDYQAWLAAGAVTSTVPNLDDLAEVLRAQLPKSTVMERVFALGFEAQIAALFAASFKLQAQWNMPGWPNIYVDDPGLLQALPVIGMTAEQIAQVTNPDPAFTVTAP